MTELSPAAQAILDAALNTDFEIDFTNLDATFEASIKQIVAVVTEVLADQVVPDGPCPGLSQFWDDETKREWQNNQQLRHQILAIAAELRGEDQPSSGTH